MKAVAGRLCRQTATPAQWQGYGWLHSNRLRNEQMKEVNVNVKLPRLHVRQITRPRLASRFNPVQIRYLRTLSGHSAGTWALSGTAIEILREAGTLRVLPPSAVPLEVGAINVKLPATYRQSQNSQKDQAPQKHQKLPTTAFNIQRSSQQVSICQDPYIALTMRGSNAANPVEVSDVEGEHAAYNPKRKIRRVSQAIPYRTHSRYDGSLTAASTTPPKRQRAATSRDISPSDDLLTQEYRSEERQTSTRARMIPSTDSEDDSRLMKRRRIRRSATPDSEATLPAQASEDLNVFKAETDAHGLDHYYQDSEEEGSVDDDIENKVDEVLPRLTPGAAFEFEQARVQRNQFRGYRSLQSAHTRFDLVVTPGMRVQLGPDSDGHIHYLHVVHILEDRNGDVSLRGISLKRHWYIYPGKQPIPHLPLTKNDLCMDLKTTPNKVANPFDWESMISVPLSRVDVARDIVFTNKSFDEISYQHRGMSVKIQGHTEVEELGLLCVRWKYAQVIANGKVVGTQTMQLEQKECDPSHGTPRILKVREYGRPTHTRRTRPNGDAVYTLGDGCAGGGLISRGFKMAGGKVVWAVDIDRTCVRTLKMNFPGAQVIECDIRDFAQKVCASGGYTVDILHVSFPCQGHSKRNPGTNPERDMKNNETILALEHLLKYVRPRILTLEQTDGIMSKNGGWWYSKLLSLIADAGYAISTRKINMAEYDNPQARYRLMVYAACPGQKLPNWPQPTCGPGLKPYRTIRQAIRGIPLNDPANIIDGLSLHDVEAHKQRFKDIGRKLDEADMEKPLIPLIDTAGAHVLFRDSDGQLYWPTFRQQMRLQTVPDEHVFAGATFGEQTTQNGNGVPCAFGKLFFESAIQALEETEREVEEWLSEVVKVE